MKSLSTVCPKFERLLLNFVSSRNIYFNSSCINFPRFITIWWSYGFCRMLLQLHMHHRLVHWKSFGDFVTATLPYVSYCSKNAVLTQTGSRTWRIIFIFDTLFPYGHDTRVLDMRRTLSSLRAYRTLYYYAREFINSCTKILLDTEILHRDCTRERFAIWILKI